MVIKFLQLKLLQLLLQQLRLQAFQHLTTLALKLLAHNALLKKVKSYGMQVLKMVRQVYSRMVFLLLNQALAHTKLNHLVMF